MPEKLPTGWVKTTLGEIVAPSRKRALPMDVPTMRYVGLEHIEPHSMRLLGYKSAREVRSSSLQFSHGDVLYGRMRPYLNKVWVAAFNGLCSAEFLVFKNNAQPNNQFLALRLNAEDFVAFANGQVSGERPRVDFERLSNFSVLMPPLTEQGKIVAKLNAAFSAVQRGETATTRALDRLQRYRAGVLRSAVSGALTRDWRKTNGNNKKTPIETGEQLLQRLLAARLNTWDEAELKRLQSAGKEPKDGKWRSRYRAPVKPRIDDPPELPPGWSWASVDQLAAHEERSLTTVRLARI